jgi:hypothetical protein
MHVVPQALHVGGRTTTEAMPIIVLLRSSATYKYPHHLRLSSHLWVFHFFSKFFSFFAQPPWQSSKESSAHTCTQAHRLLRQVMPLHCLPLHFHLHRRQPPRWRANVRGHRLQCANTVSLLRGSQS